MARPIDNGSSGNGRTSDGTLRGAGRRGTSTGKVRYGVVGLGHIAQAAVLPAFGHAKRNSGLAALISNNPRKLRELGERYSVEALYDYAGYRRCLAEEGLDAVYVATPNSEHLPFVRAAAEAGVHVLCEKPLGVTERECLEMIRACERAGVRLMTAYRLHFEAANLKAMEVVRSGEIGEPRIFNSTFCMQVKDPNIRLEAELGGGPLHDIGIYCINAARTLFRAEPVGVHAWSVSTGDRRFREVDETVSAQLRFPGDRVATFNCSFGAADTGWLELVGTKGSLCLDPAYEYTSGLTLYVNVGEKTRERTYAKRDQFAAELVYFSDCVLNGREPEPSGWEGLADVRVIRAIQQSIERGEPLELPPSPHLRHIRHPSPRQRIDRPPVAREPKLVEARSASED